MRIRMASVAGAVLMSLFGAASAQPAPAAKPAQSPAGLRSSIWLAPSGDDASCVRADPARPCATFNRAYQLARGGDTVLVSGGNYPTTDPSSGATTIFPAAKAKSGTVTFSCQGNGDVTFQAPVFSFYPGVSGIAFQGSCFRFHIPTFGYGGYPALTHDITLTRVHMDSFECVGCANVTIRQSEIGPIDACLGADDPDVHARCDPANPVEAYYATLPDGTSGLQAEPFVHNGAAGPATDFALIGDHVHGIQTRDSTTLHTGGLLVWGTRGLRLIGNTFDHNAIYDVEVNAGSNDSNLAVVGNIFGPPVYPLDGGSNDGLETPSAFREFTAGSSGATFTNWAIRYNRFVHGLTISYGSPQFENVAIIGNVLGDNTVCFSAPGLTFDANVFVGRVCGSHALRLRRFPYADYMGGDYALQAGSRVECFLTNVRHGMQPPKPKCPKHA